jgi:hypothetical protein
MYNNYVRLSGTVKRAAEAGSGVLDFALEVPNERGRLDIYDCRLTSKSEAYGQLEGFVNEGEPLEVEGHLERRTVCKEERVGLVMVTARYTTTLVYVDGIIEQED